MRLIYPIPGYLGQQSSNVHTTGTYTLVIAYSRIYSSTSFALITELRKRNPRAKLICFLAIRFPELTFVYVNLCNDDANQRYLYILYSYSYICTEIYLASCDYSYVSLSLFYVTTALCAYACHCHFEAMFVRVLVSNSTIATYEYVYRIKAGLSANT